METALDLVVPHFLWRTGSTSPQNALAGPYVPPVPRCSRDRSSAHPSPRTLTVDKKKRFLPALSRRYPRAGQWRDRSDSSSRSTSFRSLERYPIQNTRLWPTGSGTQDEASRVDTCDGQVIDRIAWAGTTLVGGGAP